MVFIFYSFIITSYLKKLIGIKFFSIKQWQAELSLISLIYAPCVPHHTKNVPPFPPACCSYNIWTALPLPSNLLFGRNLLHGGENPAKQQKSTHFSNQKNLPHQTAIFNTSFIYNCSHCCCIIFFTSGFVYRYIMLILISP